MWNWYSSATAVFAASVKRWMPISHPPPRVAFFFFVFMPNALIITVEGKPHEPYGRGRNCWRHLLDRRKRSSTEKTGIIYTHAWRPMNGVRVDCLFSLMKSSLQKIPHIDASWSGLFCCFFFIGPRISKWNIPKTAEECQRVWQRQGI